MARIVRGPSRHTRSRCFIILLIAVLVVALLHLSARHIVYSDRRPLVQDSGGQPAERIANSNQSSVQRPFVANVQPHWKTRGDGMVQVNVFDETGIGRHPILDLIELGERRWNNMVKRQSKTLKEAVAEYKRRYNRPPPWGFDQWYNFAVERGVMLVDEFDQIDHDIRPFLALSPGAMRERVKQQKELPWSYYISFRGGFPTIKGENQDRPEAMDVFDLVADFAHLLPDCDMHVSMHDQGSGVFGEDVREEIARLTATGQAFSHDNLTFFESETQNSRRSFTHACKDTAPIVLEQEGVIPARTKVEGVADLIFDHRASMNFCHNPSIAETHGTFLYTHIRNPRFRPFFVQCKVEQGSELLLPALNGFDPNSGKNILPWSQRKATALFWRGRTTGSWFNKDYDWRKSHRMHLHRFGNDRNDSLTEEVLVEDDETGTFTMKRFSRAELNERFMDVGVIAPVIQCDPETCRDIEENIDFKPEVSGSTGKDGKYAIDVDGNGWSQRYRRLLSTGALILKMTIHPEWNTDWLIPWYHYVPVQTDYRDIYHILSFFQGSLGPNGSNGHDDLAATIAANGVRFTKRNWRWEDMQAYAFRLLLEYARAASPDRDALTYHG